MPERPSEQSSASTLPPMETMFLRPRGPASGRPADSEPSQSLPPDLRRKASQRLRAVAIIYTAAFLAADWVPTIFMPHSWIRFQHLSGWVFSAASIVMGIAVAAAVSSERLGWEARVRIGLVFQVAGAYGIAAAMYAHLGDMPLTAEVLSALSPSWPAVWMVFYAVVVPARPRRALLAGLASASAAPVVIAATLTQHHLWHLTDPAEFFFDHAFPYLVCVLLVSMGARAVYQLGRDVTAARQLGSYQLLERLGQGGMGEVWRASHRLLARPAVVKFIRADALAASSAEEAHVLVRRFELEARATASLTSAHTIDLYDFGVTDEGVFYYVMEMLDGVDLDTRCGASGPFRRRAPPTCSPRCASRSTRRTRAA